MSGALQCRQWRGLAAAILLATLCACSAFAPKVQAPQLAITGVAMTSGDIFSQQFRVRLRVENPNDRELPVKAIDYKLFLQGDSFAEGTSTAPFNVPAHGETEFDITMRTNFVSSIGRLLSRFDGTSDNKVQYAITGSVRLEGGWVRKIPFTQSGVVDLKTVK